MSYLIFSVSLPQKTEWKNIMNILKLLKTYNRSANHYIPCRDTRGQAPASVPPPQASAHARPWAGPHPPARTRDPTVCDRF